MQVTAAERLGAQTADQLARNAPEFWQATCRDAEHLITAYQEATDPPGPDATASVLLARLLRHPVDPTAVTQAVTTLALHREGQYAIVRYRDRLPVSTAELRDRTAATVLPVAQPDTGTTLVASLGSADIDPLVRALDSMYPDRCGAVGPAVAGLARLPLAYELATSALHAAGDRPGLTRADHRMCATLLPACPEPARAAAVGILEPVLGLAPHERDRLLATLDTWLDNRCDTALVARQLFCHPNTIRNRLRRVEVLTGLPMNRPNNLVALTVALEAHRARTNTPRPFRPGVK
ncbi:helix-turn-helix domain-containing protein [Gordonia sp. CPCC 205515]|uniref:PucR family transcriptional regulator n=1 Tax=Gordonia sp. CPCC 205515 TaxID=3140791 RepID=UPI003AF33F09